jgi:hypothetical protein
MSNFLSNVGSTGNAATFFELAMVEQGGGSLWPAFEHVLRTLVAQSPTSNAANLLYYFARELYAVLRGVVESYFLSQQNCTAFELLYGLRRAAVIPEDSTDERPKKKVNPFQQDEPPPALTRREVVLSIFEIVLLPYFAAQMDRVYERAAEAEAETNRKQNESCAVTRSMNKRIVDSLRWCFVVLYPYLRKSFGIVLATYQLVFSLGRTLYFSPWQHFFRFNVVRHVPSPETGKDLATEMLGYRNWKERLTAWGVNAVQYGVVAGVLSFKFFEWWYTPEVQELAQKTSEDAEPPPPTTVLLFLKENDEDDAASAVPAVPRETAAVLCPLCTNQCTNMAASPSGYVYCYPCLYKYIEDHGRTPKGGLPCTVLEIRKCWVS